MICPRCGKKLLQISGMWSPKTPNLTFRKYVCDTCRTGYTEVVDTVSHEVVRIDEMSLRSKEEKQVSLMEWI